MARKRVVSAPAPVPGQETTKEPVAGTIVVPTDKGTRVASKKGPAATVRFNPPLAAAERKAENLPKPPAPTLPVRGKIAPLGGKRLQRAMGR